MNEWKRVILMKSYKSIHLEGGWEAEWAHLRSNARGTPPLSFNFVNTLFLQENKHF